MAYKKLKADQIFTGTEMLDKNYVLIADENGIIEEIVPENEAGENVQQFEGIISPGFVNCHCHLELSHLKGLIEEKKGLPHFLQSVMQQRFMDDELILDAIKNAEAEMIQNGIVAVGDICNTTQTISQKQKGNLYYHNFIELAGWNPNIALERFEKGIALLQEFNIKLNSTSSLAPHAPYSVSNALWQLLEPELFNCITTMHNQESAAENEFFKTGEGAFVNFFKAMGLKNKDFYPANTTSLQNMLPFLQKSKHSILVHNTFIEPEDIEMLISLKLNRGCTQYYFCLCVNANTFIENCFPPLELLRNNSQNIVIGTDSLASNNCLSIIKEINSIKSYFPMIPDFEILNWATYSGAKALGIENQFGSFSKGKKPGIILIKNLLDNKINII